MSHVVVGHHFASDVLHSEIQVVPHGGLGEAELVSDLLVALAFVAAEEIDMAALFRHSLHQFMDVFAEFLVEQGLFIPVLIQWGLPRRYTGKGFPFPVEFTGFIDDNVFDIDEEQWKDVLVDLYLMYVFP